MSVQLISTSTLPPKPNPSTTSFHLFPHLPKELRLKIYGHILTIPHARILWVTTKCIPGSKITSKFTSSSPPPTLLSVCSESREEALRFCSLSFHSPLYNGHIYLNPFTDLVYFGKEAIRTRGGFADDIYVDETTISKIRYLAIDLDDIWKVVHSGWRAQHCTAIHAFSKIREFVSLEELVLVRFSAPYLERRTWPGLVFEESEVSALETKQGLLGNELRSCFIQATIQSDMLREAEKYPEWNVPLVRIVDARAAGLGE